MIYFHAKKNMPQEKFLDQRIFLPKNQVLTAEVCELLDLDQVIVKS